MKKIKLAGIGCGGRTRTYLSLAKERMSEYFDIVGAADPIIKRAEWLKKYSTVEDFKVFDSDKALLKENKFADVIIIGTQDNYHVEPCIAAMKKGYDILLEKPIAPSLKEVIELEKEAKQLGKKVLVCHVLRFSPFYRKVKEIIDSGVLGEIRSLNATEGVGAFHYSHSYVRGHWSVKEKSSPIIISKSCHDMDIISWLIGEKVVSASSYGTLSYFNEENAPKGSPKRCLDGCPHSSKCFFNAANYMFSQRSWLQYICDIEGEAVKNGEKASNEDIHRWLKTAPWGKCVFHAGNNVCDHQVASFNFEKGKTATFTVTAFDDGRNIEIYGTKGSLKGGHMLKHQAETGSDIIVSEHATGNKTMHHVNVNAGGYDGHGGGDHGLVSNLYDEMSKENPEDMSSSISQSIESHIMGYAAEESRVTGQTVVIKDFLEKEIKSGI